MVITLKESTRLLLDEKAIRTNVFVNEQGFQNEFDDIDATSFHIVLYIDGVAACCCRYFASDSRVYILGRLATLPLYRGKGLARRMVKAVEERVMQAGGITLRLHAQVQARPFYESLGYTPQGAIDFDEGVPHVWMKKDVSKDVSLDM